MENVLECISESPYFGLTNLLLAIFATVISIGYLLKPRIYFCAFVHNNMWKARVINKNFFFSVKEIQCEIAVSETNCFSKEKTLELKKGNTLILRKYKESKDDYIFRTKLKIDDIQNEHRELMKKSKDEVITHEHDYQFLRVRLLASNFLGIKKHYKRIYKIASLKKINYGNIKAKPISQCAHRKKEKKDLC